MMEDTSPDEQPPDPRFRWGIRIALIIGVAFALALEFRRESPQPLQPRAEDQVAGQPTNAPVITAGFDRLGAYPVTMPKVIEDEQGMYMHDKTPIIDQGARRHTFTERPHRDRRRLHATHHPEQG